MAETATFVSGTQLTTVVPAGQLASGSMLSVVAANGTTVSGTSTPVSLEVDNPVPMVSALLPAMLTTGSAPGSVSVTGTGFVPATTVQVNGTARMTTYVSATQVTFLLTAADLTAGGSLSVTASNPAPMGGSSPAASVAVNNPAPGNLILSPAAVFVGTAAPTTITVMGSGFLPSSVVQVGSSARTTTYVGANQLTFQLTVADQAATGSLGVSVVNAAPGGGISAVASVAVNNPLPGSLLLSPAAAVLGTATPTTITVTGSNFVRSSVVQVGTAARATTYVSATQLTFQLSVADQATAARLNIVVVNPAPGGGMSPVAALGVTASASYTPVITSVSPTSFTAGPSDTYISVYGLNLTAASTIQWNGTALMTQFGTAYNGYGSSTYLLGNVPASLVSTAGSATVTVYNSTASVPLSNSLTVTIVNPPAPTLTSISPSSGPINTAETITLYGSGFTASSTVAYNGTTLASTYVNATSMTATLAASSVSLPGNGNFTVTTPAPGGGTTAPLAYTAYIGIANNSMIYNPVSGLFYVSVPSSAGTPFGNSIVSVDPATGAFGTPIFVGSEPNKLAITSDGRYLWVGLDGASAIRKVDLTAGIAGLQFSLGGNGGIYETPGTALALAALPGATDSVVVSATNQSYGGNLAIYDSGVIRGTSTTGTSFYGVDSLLVNGTTGEVYGGSNNTYNVYTYSATGLTLQSSVTSGSYASSSADEMQIVAGRLYTDFGRVYDAESASLLGTFYLNTTTVAGGPTTADATLGRAFILGNTSYAYGAYNQIQIFNLADFNQTSNSTIPVNVGNSNGLNGYASRLTRWGTNGLAFRTSMGVYSLRSNLVKDLSTVSADLGVTVSATGGLTTGMNTTYTATVSNAGPSAATNVVLTASVPSSGVLSSATAAAGTCSTSGSVDCDLGSLASGASTTVTFAVLNTSAGSAIFTAQVTGSENDPVATNNQASATATVTGNAYNLTPAVASISPAAIATGAADTVVTINGTGFGGLSTAYWNGSALLTTYVSGTQLTATVPASDLLTLGWGALTVMNPAPGGGSSTAVPLTVFQVLTAGINHILYDPYDRKLYASVASGSSTLTGNSIVAITPETGTFGTPVNIGSQPTKMAMSDDGKILYTLLGGANSIARFNLLTQQAEFTVSVTNPSTSYAGSSNGYRDLAVQPGGEDTLALDFGYTGGLGLVDFNPSTSSAALRGGTGTGIYTGTSLQFLSPQRLLVYNSDTWQTLDGYPITSNGFSYSATHDSSTLLKFSAFKLRGNTAFANAGGVADVSQTPAVQLGVFPPLSTYSYSYSQITEPDTSLGRVFFLTETSASSSFGSPDGVAAYDPKTFLPTAILPFNIAASEGNTSYTGVDLIRWGQDGLAALTSGGHIYLLRGPVVTPQLLNTNSAAVLTASSLSTIVHGTGNTLLTLTGSNFIPGVAVSWNGGYRTTTIVDATHVTVAIPAADLASAGSASLVATNPGATASATVTVTIN